MSHESCHTSHVTHECLERERMKGIYVRKGERRKGGRKGGKEEWREREREEGNEEGREGGREGWRAGGRVGGLTRSRVAKVCVKVSVCAHMYDCVCVHVNV